MPISPEEAVRRLANAATTIAGPGSERALVQAGVAARVVMSTPDTRLSGYGRGSRRGTVVGKAGFETEPGLKIVVHPTRGTRGLWALLEFGSKSSTWKRPRRRGVRGSGRGTYQRRPVPARHTWSQAQPRASREAFHAYHRSLTRQVFANIKGAG